MRREKRDGWKVRRRFMFIVTAFCMVVIVYCIARGLDTKVAESAVIFAFLTIAGIVGSYVFAASWEDISKVRVGGDVSMGMYGPPYAPPDPRPPGMQGE